MGDYSKTGDNTGQSIGTLLTQARIDKGHSLAALAREMRMPQHLLAAIENEKWEQVPPGRERPLVRRIAEYLELDLSQHKDAWSRVPGALPSDAPDPHRERLERILMTVLSVGTVVLVLWLVVPGPDLKGPQDGHEVKKKETHKLVWVPKKTDSPFPVMGELIPDPPITSEGILVTMRAAEASTLHITNQEGKKTLSLQASDPLTLRVKGPFSLLLERAGGVTLEVAGHRINHGATPGDPWSGQFDDKGIWLLPRKAPVAEPVGEMESPEDETMVDPDPLPADTEEAASTGEE